jgi:hypothetical protein
VVTAGSGVTVRFHSYSGLGRDQIYENLDRYEGGGDYCFTTERSTIAVGPSGFVF